MDYVTGGQAAEVVADDTDIFVMLLYHYCDRSNDGLASINRLAAVFLIKKIVFLIDNVRADIITYLFLSLSLSGCFL